MIYENKQRIGNFTSSSIADLMTVSRDKKSFGAPALNYIAEKNMERKLRLPLHIVSDSKPTLWGKCMESRVFEKLGLSYKLCSQETIVHPGIDCWAGSPDAEKFDEGKTVVDIKCPFTRKSFCEFYDCNTIEKIRENHKDGEKYYWQLVSNSILTNSKYAELIFYMPYFSELEEVKQHSVDIEFTKAKNEFAWIFHSPENELPYLSDDGFYKNLKCLRFEVSENDKNALINRVKEAGKKLLKCPCR